MTVGDCLRIAEAHGDPGVHPIIGVGFWNEAPYWSGGYVYVLYDLGVFVGIGPCTSPTPIVIA